MADRADKADMADRGGKADRGEDKAVREGREGREDEVADRPSQDVYGAPDREADSRACGLGRSLRGRHPGVDNDNLDFS